MDDLRENLRVVEVRKWVEREDYDLNAWQYFWRKLRGLPTTKRREVFLSWRFEIRGPDGQWHEIDVIRELGDDDD